MFKVIALILLLTRVASGWCLTAFLEVIALDLMLFANETPEILSL